MSEDGKNMQSYERALSVFIRLAEVSGFISKETSLATQRNLKKNIDPQVSITNHLSKMIQEFKLERNAATLIWKITQLAPATTQEIKSETTIGTSKYSTILKTEEVAENLRDEIRLAEELLKRKLVPLEAINNALESIQVEKSNLSLGQILLRKHLLSPGDFVQLKQECQSNVKNKIQSTILMNSQKGVVQLSSPNTPTVIGRYEIIREIARGGMGVVYEASDMELNRVVALKTLIIGEMANEEDVERFLQEAKLTASFNHPGIVPIHEIGIHENVHFFTMDYIDGVPIDEYVKKTRMNARKIMKMVIQIAEALGYAHSKGIIHRDIKPGNILVDHSGNPLLMDFGLAKQQNVGKGLTMSGVALGTPAYMPPEQAEGKLKQIDARSDIYSLGAVLYELIAGRPPFTGTSLAETLQAVIHEEPVSLKNMIPGLALDVDTICMKCLAKDKNKRYSSIKAMLRDMERFIKGDHIRAKRTSLQEKAIKWCKQNVLIVAIIAGILLFFTIFYQSKLSDLAKIKSARKTAEKKAKEALLAKKEAEEQATRANDAKIEAEKQAKKAEELRKQALEEQRKALLERKKALLSLAKANFLRGILLANMKKYKSSIKAFSKTVAITPGHYMAYHNRGIIFYKLERYRDAIADFSKVIQLKPTYSEAFQNRGVIYLTAFKDYEKARDDLSKAEKLTPKDHNIAFHHATALLRLKCYEEAIAKFTRAYELDPSEIVSLYFRGDCYYLTGQYRKALRDYQFCVRRNIKSKKIHTKIKKCLRKLGK